MKSMIDELWYGNVSPMDDTRNNTEEMKELMSYIARHQEELVATLTDEQKEIFEYAFRLGARLSMEIQKDTDS